MSGDSDRDGPGEAHSQDEQPNLDVDAAFAQIVAGWADEAPDPLGRWSATGDADTPPQPDAGTATDPTAAIGATLSAPLDEQPVEPLLTTTRTTRSRRDSSLRIRRRCPAGT